MSDRGWDFYRFLQNPFSAGEVRYEPQIRAAVLGLPTGAVLVPRRPITLAFHGVPFLGGHQNVSLSLDYGT